ncbi:hypothetical protein [Streptomyces sp. NPDC048442]|uniref:hypothetical protein n=1 Tax=Streptomyces sp. NPDC048442 TaxID=3154823 RepID=UPI0034237E6F
MQTQKPQTDANAEASGWLARAHQAPDVAPLEWTERHVAVLPLGSRFDAVRIPVEVVYAAVGTRNQAAVGPLLEAVLGGPVIQDSERWFYPLVPVGGAPNWIARSGTYLGHGWLGVPRTDQLAEPGMYWSVPMRAPGRLCDLMAVAELVEVGFARLSGEGGQ